MHAANQGRACCREHKCSLAREHLCTPAKSPGKSCNLQELHTHYCSTSGESESTCCLGRASTACAELQVEGSAAPWPHRDQDYSSTSPGLEDA